MKPILHKLDSSLVEKLIDDTLSSYDPQSTNIELMDHAAIDELRDIAARAVGRPLYYWKAFLFVATETTMETVSSDASDGWHIDGSTTDAGHGVDCFNTWIPLYVSGASTGLAVIPREKNVELYACLGDARLPLGIYTRERAPEVLQQLQADSADFVFIRHATGDSVAALRGDLYVETIDAPVVGDAAIFYQNDIHRGFHEDGVRIQLSIKFTDSPLTSASRATHAKLKELSKHGRLEGVLVRELLKISKQMLGS
ncbi:hypothetical protein FIV34_16525 [Luteibacter pinisoli]|uniref:Phytanoyl-CoA dioxygenase family protein n=1 Tax=Luteibacter pinisoli TaxID=2589080 RepID=A0A4Y5Z668_9GAMM|nr:hypothetical protein [Luteibacter pinisoli]QDE40697.1 hypothetical protein FIV34_16525 [Luteibacter pinisoli]